MILLFNVLPSFPKTYLYNTKLSYGKTPLFHLIPMLHNNFHLKQQLFYQEETAANTAIPLNYH